MFQSNAAKEVLYIFLWLIGIILLYALVHTFLLEPSTNTHPVADTTSTKTDVKPRKDNLSSSIKTDKVPTVAKTTTPSVSPIVKKPTANKLVQAVPKNAKKVHTPSINEKKVSKQDNISLRKVTTPTAVHKRIKLPSAESTITTLKSTKKKNPLKVPTLITIPSAISVPSLPSIPSIPSVPVKTPSIPNVDKISAPQVKRSIQTNTIQTKKVVDTTVKSDTPMETLGREISRDEKMKLIETARKHVIEEAEISRKKAMDAFNQ